jgi:hypothetical protein
MLGRVLLLLLVLVGGAAEAQTGSSCSNWSGRASTPFANQLLVVSSTPVGFDPNKIQRQGAAAAFAEVTVEGDAIRYLVYGRDSGFHPTAAIGHLITVGTTFIVCGQAVGRFEAVRVTNDAQLTITYYYFQ